MGSAWALEPQAWSWHPSSVLSVWPWENDSTSLCLSFLNCETGLMITGHHYRTLAVYWLLSTSSPSFGNDSSICFWGIPSPTRCSIRET